jgi:hypothetical protein
VVAVVVVIIIFYTLPLKFVNLNIAYKLRFLNDRLHYFNWHTYMSRLTIIFFPFFLLTDGTDGHTYGPVQISDSFPICPSHSGQRNLCFRVTAGDMRTERWKRLVRIRRS